MGKFSRTKSSRTTAKRSSWTISPDFSYIFTDLPTSLDGTSFCFSRMNKYNNRWEEVALRARSCRSPFNNVPRTLCRQQDHVRAQKSHWQGRVRPRLEGHLEAEQTNLRHESDGQSQNNNQKECLLSPKLAIDPMPAPAPVHRQHALRVPGPREPVPADRLPGVRRPSLLHALQVRFQVGASQ